MKIIKPLSENMNTNFEKIKKHMETIVDIIKNKLSDTLFSNITKNVNNITDNINNLKLIESKLIDPRVKVYDKVTLNYEWLRNYVIKEEPKVEIKQTEEIKTLLKEISTTGKIMAPVGDLSKDEATQLMLKFIIALPNRSDYSIDVFNKLKDKKNAELFIKTVNETYPGNKNVKCKIFSNILARDPVDKVIFDEHEIQQDCKKHEQEQKNKKPPQTYPLQPYQQPYQQQTY